MIEDLDSASDSELASDSVPAQWAMELASDSVPVLPATELASDSVPALSAMELASESDSPSDSDLETAPEFDSASDSRSAPQAQSPERILPYPLLPACVAFAGRAQRALA